MFSFFRSVLLFLFFVAAVPGRSQTPPVPLPLAEQLGTDTRAEVPDYVIIHQIGIIGNKVTKRHIIVRELSFLENDTIARDVFSKKLVSARENLLNTSLFNFVTIDTIPVTADRMQVLVTVAERWYTWPVPVFEVQERNFNTWWQTRNFERANYGFFLDRDNFRGRKESLSFYFQFGYTEKYGITYKVPYLNRKQTSGAGASFSYSRNHEVMYTSIDNQVLFFKDPDRYVREEFTGKLFYAYRRGIYQTHTVETKFIKANIHDTLRSYSADYFTNGATDMQFLSLDYVFRLDHRDIKIFPLKGYFFEFEATRLGFGILNGEDVDVLNLLVTVKKYMKLSNRFYFSSGFRMKYSADSDQPYYVQRGLGWGDYVRGYEYYVMDAQSYGTAKVGLKYEIIKPRIRSIPLPLEKFNTFHYALYAGIYGDAGYADDRQYALVNPLSNTLLYGYGAGLELVTYYDMIFRLEYSFNKMLEHGFFVSFNAGI